MCKALSQILCFGPTPDPVYQQQMYINYIFFYNVTGFISAVITCQIKTSAMFVLLYGTAHFIAMRMKRLCARFSDDDESTSNPLVAGFQDDVDSDDQQSPGDTATASTNTHVDLSSDEEEEMGTQSSAVVTSSRDSVIDSDLTVPSESLAQLPIQWTLGGSTSHDGGGSKLPHEDISIVPSATAVSVVDSDQSDDDSDDASIVAMVTAVQNEVSDDEVTPVGDRSVVDGAPTPHDTTQVNIA